MAFIMFLGSTLTEYNKKLWEYMNMQVFLCKECGGIMTYHGCYYRKIKENDNTICINRLCCRACKHTEAVLPDFLIPYKQYSANEVEAVLIDADVMVAEDIETVASVSTARRWIRNVGNEIKGWIISFKPLFKEIQFFIGLNLMEQLSILIAILPRARNSGNLLGAVQIYLSNQAHNKHST